MKNDAHPKNTKHDLKDIAKFVERQNINDPRNYFDHLISWMKVRAHNDGLCYGITDLLKGNDAIKVVVDWLMKYIFYSGENYF